MDINNFNFANIDPKVLNQYLQNTINILPENFRNYIDTKATNYLRDTTTDQEILDFYGEGNIIGRKGIPSTDKKLLDSLSESTKNLFSSLRPELDRPKFSVGGIDQEIGYKYQNFNMPNIVDPTTQRPWQMTFGSLPVDFGSRGLTPAAQQFLVDFRIPNNAGYDYSFATGPNIQDRIDVETKQLLDNNPYFNNPEALNKKIEKIKTQSSWIGDFSGQPITPQVWQKRGYITEKPTNFKTNVLNEFTNKIFETQGPFGGVSTLTPVEDRSASNPNWRSDLYERSGLAGPIDIESYNTGYGRESKDVQRFTTGKERLLPLQPYNEFFQNAMTQTRPSALNTEPGPDFTRLQTAIGPRNYLIGKNLLEGRGTAGQIVRRAGTGAGAALQVGALDLIPSPEVIRQLGENPNDPSQAASTFAREFAAGVPTAAGIGAATAAVPALGNVVSPVAGGLALINAGQTANQVYRQATGKDWITRNQPRPFVSTAPSETPQIVPRMGTAILNGKEVQVPWGSVAGIKEVGRPAWDVIGTPIRKVFDSLSGNSAQSFIGGGITQSSRPIGTRAVLGGKPVQWNGRTWVPAQDLRTGRQAAQRRREARRAN